jgi:hypothetical protein
MTVDRLGNAHSAAGTSTAGQFVTQRRDEPAMSLPADEAAHLRAASEKVSASPHLTALAAAVDDVVMQACALGDEAHARAAARSVSPLDEGTFTRRWTATWAAAWWSSRFADDPAGAAFDDDPVGNGLVDVEEYRGWSGPDRDGEDGYGGYDYEAMGQALAEQWSDERRALVCGLLVDSV